MDIRVTFTPFTGGETFTATTEGGEAAGITEAFDRARAAAKGGDVIAEAQIWSPELHDWVAVGWGEYSGPAFFAELAEAASAECVEPEVLLAYAECFYGPEDSTPEEFVTDAVDRYYGCFDGHAELGEYLLDEMGSLGNLPAGLEAYINFEAYGRDLCLGGDFTMSASGHTFINH
jgi:antirestriction protein